MAAIHFEHWSAQDWVAHYAGPQFDPNRAEVGSIWDAYGRRLPGYVQMGSNGQPQVYHAGQTVAQRAAQTASQIAQRGQQTAQSAIHGMTSLAHQGIAATASTAPKLAGVAAIGALGVLGILAWVVVQQGRTVGRTIRGVAPHVGKAISDVAPHVSRTAEALGPAAAKALPLLAL